MEFEVVGPLRDVRTFAVGHAIRDLARLRRVYGGGRWRKRKRMPPSGEDYLYPAKFFMRVDLPQPLRSALRRAG